MAQKNPPGVQANQGRPGDRPWPVSLPGGVVISNAGILSLGNSSTIPLVANGVFTGVAEAIAGFSAITISVFADQTGASPSISVQFSKDGINWDHVLTFNYATASTSSQFLLSPEESYFRIVYTNGGVAQGVFRLQTLYHTLAIPGTFNLPGCATMAVYDPVNGVVNPLRAMSTIADGISGGANTSQGVYAFNGTNWDRFRNNLDVTLLASASRTTTQTSADITTYNLTAISVVLDMTDVTALPSVTLSIKGKDVASGKYYTILTGAAVTTVSTNLYRVHPGITAVVNADVNAHLPRTIQIVVTANNANAGTYSVGYSLHG